MDDFTTETIASRRESRRKSASARRFPADWSEDRGEATVFKGDCPVAPTIRCMNFPTAADGGIIGRSQTGLMARPITALQAAG